MTTATETFRQARDFLFQHRTDYDAAYAGFEWPTFDRFNWALDWFDDIARRKPDQLALWIVEEAGAETKLSFAELTERSNRLANHLRGLGVARGDRVLLMLPNVAPLWETVLASMKLGAVVIPATVLLTGADLVDRVARGRVRHVVAAAEHAAKFDDLPADVTRIAVGAAVAGWHSYEDCYDASPDFTPDGATHPDDPMLLYFTSGTTAKPKLVLHSHRSYPVGHLSTVYWIGLQPGDLHLNVSSPGWAKHAWSSFFAPWIAEATIFVLNQPRFNARGMLDALVRCKVTTLCAPPTVWRLMIQEDLAAWPVTLREVVGAGEPLNPEVIDRVRAGWGLTIRDGFGQTETTAQIGNPPGQPLKSGSMGRPLPGYRVRLLDPDGEDAEEGEISLALDPAPAALMLGYQDEAGGITHVSGVAYRTGDVASRDADGYITYVGRADDVFKASDYRISPFELESVLIEHEAIAEAAVVPAPDPVRLATPKAYISLVAGRTPSRELALSIFQHLRAQLAPYKRIRRIEFADLPKTISGKIRRVELRAQESDHRGTRGTTEFWEEDFTW